MATVKTIEILASELSRLNKYRDQAIEQRDKDSEVTIKVVGTDDIVLSDNQGLFFDGLIKTLNTTIDQTKKNIHDLMYPESNGK